jgi:predicted metal-dependent hydrolase
MPVSEPSYTVRRSDRARRARIQVTAEGVEVVVPRRLSLDEVEPFVQSKRAWIERTLLRMRAAEAERPRPSLDDGGEVPFLGERLGLRIRVEPERQRDHVARHGDELVISVSEPDQDVVRAALERWYRAQARTEVAIRLDAAVARVGQSYSSLQIRGQRSRWASCSAKGGMSFNWRLLLAPPEILDYVVEHEVAHLEIHDHSARFWSLLAARRPGYRAEERWLRANGHTLRL